MKDMAALSSVQSCILSKDGLYSLYGYKNENELERLVIKNFKHVFGNRSIYVDAKQKVMSKVKVRVTDGLVLDLTDVKAPRFWLVEYELSSHDTYRIVEPQIRGFLRALRVEETLAKIRETVYEEVKASTEKMTLVREVLGKETDVHYEIDKMLHGKVGIIIIIDNITEQLNEVIEDMENLGEEVKVIEFKTYTKNGENIHEFTPLSRPEPVEEIREGRIVRLWQERLAWTFPQTKEVVDALIKRVTAELPAEIIHKPRYKWYSFYSSEPTKRKNEFLVLLLGKNNITAAIRVDPEKFSDPKGLTRPIERWFFPRGTERRFTVTLDNMDNAINLIKQSYEVLSRR